MLGSISRRTTRRLGCGLAATVPLLAACSDVLGVNNVYLDDKGDSGMEASFVDDDADALVHDAGTDETITTLDASDSAIDAPDDETETPAGDTRNCDRLGNVLFLDGSKNDFVFGGRKAWFYGGIEGGWQAQVAATRDAVRFTVGGLSDTFHVDIATAKIPSLLVVDAFANAEKFGSESSGRPGLNVDYNGRSCSAVAGKVWIAELLWNGNDLTHFVAAFEQRCNGSPAVLRGCLKYDAP